MRNPSGTLPETGDDSKTQPEVVDELLALDAEELRDDEFARAGHGVSEAHGNDATRFVT